MIKLKLASTSLGLTNNDFKPDDNEKELILDFDTNIQYNENKTDMIVDLSAVIFSDAGKKNYPFEMKVTLKGYFIITAQDMQISQFEVNAIAILFSYLRALVSTFTANSNNVPVIIPPMNINAFLANKKISSERNCLFFIAYLRSSDKLSL